MYVFRCASSGNSICTSGCSYCPGVRRGLCPHCAKVGYFESLSPMAPVTAVTTVFPYADFYSVQNSDNELEQTMFRTENARLLSKSAAFALWT